MQNEVDLSHCSCIQVRPGSWLEPPEWEQNPNCPVHPMKTWKDHAWNIHKGIVKDWKVGSKEDLRFLVLGLVGETGELANLIKKEWRGSRPLIDSELEEELADIRIYLELIAMITDTDLDEACEKKIPILYDRWPEIEPV